MAIAVPGGRRPTLRARSLLNLRGVLIAACGVLAVAAATGVVASHAFSSPTTVKYAVTVVAPLLVIAACLSEDPLRLLTGAAILAAPWELVATFGGVTISPLTVLLVLGSLVALFDADIAMRAPTATGSVVVVAVVLLLPSFAIGDQQGHYATWIASTLAAGWLSFLVARRPGGFRLVLMLVVAAAGVQALIAVYEYARHVNLDLYSANVGQTVSKNYFFNFGNDFRPDGTLPDPIALGNTLAVACPLAMVLALSASTQLARLTWTASALLIAIALTLSFSRASWIAVGVGIAVAVLALPGRRRLPAAVTVAALVVVTILVGLTLGGSNLRQRFSSISDPTARANSTAKGDLERQQIWDATLKQFSAQPVVGVGLGELQGRLSQHLGGSPAGLHAHSVYFQFLAESGVAGLLALLLLVGHAGTSVLAMLRSDRLLAAGAAGAFVAMLVTWATDTSARAISTSAALAFLFGAVMAHRGDGQPGAADA